MAADTCWAYLVVSSDLQAETVPDQARWAKETAATNGWLLERSFEGVASGKAGVRKIMQELLEQLRATPKAKRPRRILMVRLDRTGRGDTLELIATIAEIRRLGVTIHTRTDGDIRLENVKDSIKPIFEMIQAGLENEARSDRSRAGHEAKRRAGKHSGHAPYGTVLVDGKPRPYEPEAIIVREIFERRLQGWGTHRLARYAATFAPPKKKADGSVRKMRWGENSIARMLACKTYGGIVVEETLFDAVQAIRHRPIDKTAKYDWPLRGAVRCTCGLLVTTCRSGNAKYRVRYYMCRNVAVHRDRYPFHRADVLESQFAELLTQLAADPELISGYRHNGADISALRSQRAVLERDLKDQEQRRKRVWELAEEGDLDGGQLRIRLAEIAAEHDRLSAAIAELDREITLALATQERHIGVAEALENMAQKWATADVEMKREIAKAVSAVCGGLYVMPAESASKTVLQYGMKR